MASFDNIGSSPADARVEVSSEPELSSFGGEAEGDSQEERIAWLRKRGVLIEIPGERKTASSSTTADGEETRSVMVVRIPCNDTLAYEEIEVKVSTRVGGDGLLTALRPYFSSSVSDIDSSVLRATAAKQFGNADVQVSTAALQKLSEQGAVEAFTLDSPSEANGFRGVSLYLDEAGQLKSLAPNRRATALARACGFENVPLVGDMFVGRMRVHGANGGTNCTSASSSSEDVGIYSEDFVLAEMDSSASWIQGAQKRNYDLGVARGKVEMQSGGGGSDEGELNGGVNAKQGYRWSETMGQVDVVLSLADTTLTAKQLVVKFTSKSVRVSTKTEPSVSLMQLNLAGSVSIDDCTWTASKGELEISMEKTTPTLWSKLTSEE